jgi:hypothetical protein
MSLANSICLKAEKVKQSGFKKHFGIINMFFRLKKCFFVGLSASSQVKMEGKSFIHHRQNMNATFNGGS